MGSKKKRTRGAGVARTFEGNRAIALTAPEISRGVEPAELPHRPASANSSGEIASRAERSLSESRFEAIQDDDDDILDDAVPTTTEEWIAVAPVLLRKATAFVRSRSERDDPEAREVVACLAEQVAIAIDLLLAEKPTAGPDPTMKKVLERLEAIENKVSARTEATPPPKAGKSWAQVAASVPAKYVPRAYTLEVTVQTGQKKDDDRRSNDQVVDMVNRTLGMGRSDDDPASARARAARHLPSGDWKIMFNTEEARKIAETTTGWVKRAFNPNATVARKGYTVVAHGLSSQRVRGAAMPQFLLEKIKAENNVEVVRVVVPKTAKKKTRTPLYVAVSTVDDANALCTRGVVVEGTWYPCEPFADGAALRQCYRCYGFGHVAKMCTARAVRCGYCSSTHRETECQAKKDDLEDAMLNGTHAARTRCVNCAEKHPAWSKQCPVRAKWIAQAKERWADRPRYFISPDYSKKTTQENATTAANPATVGLRNGNATRKRRAEPDEASRPARHRGRPPASSVLARPDHGSRDISQMIAAMSQSADNTMVLDDD